MLEDKIPKIILEVNKPNLDALIELYLFLYEKKLPQKKRAAFQTLG